MLLIWTNLFPASSCPVWANALPEAIELLGNLTSEGIRKRLLLMITL